MANDRSQAIDKLRRWRAFQESIAQREHRRALVSAAEAEKAVEEAKRVAEMIESRRHHLMAAPSLDLGLLYAVSEFEQMAWDKVHACVEASDQADIVRDRARERHAQARSRTQVADARHERIAAIDQDAEDKRIYDRMAALVAALPMRASHD
jgi:hypothetical protein